MNAKAYDKKTAAFAGFLIQNVPDSLTDEVMQGWMDNPAATKRFLSGLMPPNKDAKPSTSFFSVNRDVRSPRSPYQEDVHMLHWPPLYCSR